MTPVATAFAVAASTRHEITGVRYFDGFKSPLGHVPSETGFACFTDP